MSHRRKEKGLRKHFLDTLHLLQAPKMTLHMSQPQDSYS